MTIRLDPRYPVVWRSPDTLQVGIDHPVVVIRAVSDGLERVVAALASGVPRSGAIMLGRQAGASTEATLAMLRALRPALIITEETPAGNLPAAGPGPLPAAGPDAASRAVCVDGLGPTAERIRTLLADLGLLLADPDGAGAALAIVVGHYALEPDRHGRWLRRDVPHLPVLFSDREVRIGPLVEPGVGPCLYCLELNHIDADPAWPAIACQLLTRRAPTETPRASIEVAVRVAGLAHDRVHSGRSTLVGASLVIDAESGVLRRLGHRPHERCGCRSLPENVTALSGSAAGGPPPTSSARADDVPA
jgi:bacteriocin biosynthesis cyclodehydratase domain-containing protein